jgi:hypothetical protein
MTERTDPSYIPAPVADRARELAGDAGVALAVEVHRDGFERGRSLGFEILRSRAEGALERRLRVLEHAHDALGPAQVGVFDETFNDSKPSPLVAAHFGAAGDEPFKFRELLGRLTSTRGIVVGRQRGGVAVHTDISIDLNATRARVLRSVVEDLRDWARREALQPEPSNNEAPNAERAFAFGQVDRMLVEVLDALEGAAGDARARYRAARARLAVIATECAHRAEPPRPCSASRAVQAAAFFVAAAEITSAAPHMLAPIAPFDGAARLAAKVAG